MPYIVASQKNAYDISCYVAGLDTSYSYDDRDINWYYNNQFKGTSYLSAYASSGGFLKATGLIPNTQYNIEARIYKNNTLIVALSGTATTSSAPIALWDWYYPKESGSNLNLTPAEWTAFCNKINEVRKYYKDNGLKNLYPYSFTLDSENVSKDKSYGAYMFLQASNAINEINGQVNSACLNVKSAKVSMGNDSIIYPWYFENLKTALNNAIK